MTETTWRKLISNEMVQNGDLWENVVSCTLSDSDLDKAFDAGYGLVEGQPFTIWTRTHVYFPASHGGAEWATSVSRNPDGKPTDHV